MVTDYFVYVGTFTAAPTPPEPPRPSSSKGIYVFRFHSAKAVLTPLGLAAATFSPSFFAIHPNHRFLYAVVNRKNGDVRSFAIHPQNGKLSVLNEAASHGDNPCFIDTDRVGKNVLVANYTSGSVAVLPIQPDGRLGEASAVVEDKGHSINPERQQGPHAHMISTSPDNRFAVISDLGLDKLLVFRFNADKGTLAANKPPFVRVKAGSGPRHFCFLPSGTFAYVISEMASTVTAFAYDAKSGAFKEVQTISTLPNGFKKENTGAEIEMHPSGKFLYASNRGLDSIAVFAIDPGRGTLRLVDQVSTQGRGPRAFELDPTGSFLFAANQISQNLVTFRINPRTGRLTLIGQVDVPVPACVKFVPAGQRRGL
ncbi:MAG: lactonase family protein [Terriglobia bacterium]